MSKIYQKALTPVVVPQSKAENELQIANNAGGFSFEVSPQQRLERFLILGTDGGTYYVKEAELTKQNMDWLVAQITLAGDGGLSILNTVVEVSQTGRAYRNSAAIFTLALLFKHAPTVLKLALISSFTKIVRTATHLYEFCGYIELMGAWGRAKRDAVASWFTSKEPGQLAYQAVKYRQRNGWTLRDAMRLSHPKGIDQNLGNFILGKDSEVSTIPLIHGFTWAQAVATTEELLAVLGQNPELPWEALPTQFLKDTDIWKKLFYNGQISGQALVRNVTRLGRIGAFSDMVFAADYAARLADEEMISRTRLHPINYLNALITYTEGQVQRESSFWYGMNRKMDWTVAPTIRDALNEGFYTAFKFVEPTMKRTLLALDVSSSMGAPALGIDLSCSQVSAAMAMTIARSEPYYDVMAFNTQFSKLDIAPSMSLNEAINNTKNATFGGTNCALPMVWALENKIAVDTFVVLTDSETWAGHIYPHVALTTYRDKMSIDAKLVVVGMTSTGFTIADPRDRGMLDIVGADANLPKVVAEFSAGRI